MLAALGHFGSFLGQVAWRTVTPPWSLGEFARHTWILTVRSALPVGAVVFPLGMVLALQALEMFTHFGTKQLLASLIGATMFREISPVLASALVASQGGSAFAAELGAMRTHEELDATEVMGVDALRIHVAPRVWAAAVATPMLNLLGTLSGVTGGWFTAALLKGEPSGVYWANLWGLTTPMDLFGSLFKTFVFGLIIGLVATYRGFNARGGAEGVGRAVNDTVVEAVTAFVVVNYFLTSALFGAAR